jgi:hypothetical protein
MKRSLHSPRIRIGLSESVDHKLNMYALAAGAAGVGMLSLTPRAEAKVVYVATRVDISRYTGIVKLDLNNDGVVDFAFDPTSTSGYAPLKVVPASQANEVWGSGKDASALGRGVLIGPKGKFQQGPLLMAGEAGGCSSTCTSHSFGPWVDVTRGYLGLKFSIQGEIHYGWARLDVTASYVPFAAITGYAYETIPNKPIITGRTKGEAGKIGRARRGDHAVVGATRGMPASLGALACGSPWLDLWRKRDAREG